jgi:hypothetical protein
MRQAAALLRFIVARRLVFPGLLILFNLASAAQSFASGDWKRGIYWLSSALCLLMVAL